MNLHQFRFAHEAVRCKLNLTEVAKSLHTSQPGVSKAILELEEELGIEIFTRHGKRLIRITEPGLQVLKSIAVILRELTHLKRIGEEYSDANKGTLSIASTHTQARYVLPGPVAKLRAAFPDVNVCLHQGSPEQVARMLIDEVAEIGVATESLADYEELLTLPCYEWQHVVVVPVGHPLDSTEPLTLQQLAEQPLITYHPAYTGRTRIDRAFEACQLTPRMALEAIDSDVIKTYVRLGLGVGIAAEMSMRDGPEAQAAPDLVARPAGHLFGQNVTRVAFKREAYLRNFVYTFAELLSTRLTRCAIEAAADAKSGLGHADRP